MWPQFQLATINAGNIKYIINATSERLGLPCNGGQCVSLGSTCRIDLQKLDAADDGIERRAKLMTHGADESPLRLTRRNGTQRDFAHRCHQ